MVFLRFQSDFSRHELQDVRDALKHDDLDMRPNEKASRAAMEIRHERRLLKIATAKWMTLMDATRIPTNLWDVKWRTSTLG